MRTLHLRPRFVLAAAFLLLNGPIQAADKSSSQSTNTGQDIVNMAKVQVAADFAPQSVYYVALRWVLATPSAGPVKVAEVSAFARGDSHHAADLLVAADPADLFKGVEPPDVVVASP